MPKKRTGYTKHTLLAAAIADALMIADPKCPQPNGCSYEDPTKRILADDAEVT